MFKKRYQKLNDSIIPDQTLVEQVKRLENKKREKRRILPLKIATAVTAIMIIFVSFPILAGYVPVVYEMLYFVSPEAAQYFIPIQKSYEKNGIKMEVMTISVQGDKAQVYITMQDIIGNRIDETIDLNDSYYFKKAFNASASCYLVEYDDEVKKATFLIEIERWGGKEITDRKFTFVVRNFLSHKKEYEEIPIPIEEMPESQLGVKKISLTGIAENSNSKSFSKKVIKPYQEVDFGIENVAVTGIGFVEEEFCIQIGVRNRLQNDNHGTIYLQDLEGNIKNCEGIKYFCEEKNGEMIDYMEYVFDVTKEELSSYKAYGNFITSTMYTEGEWKVTFSLNNQQ